MASASALRSLAGLSDHSLSVDAELRFFTFISTLGTEVPDLGMLAFEPIPPRPGLVKILDRKTPLASRADRVRLAYRISRRKKAREHAGESTALVDTSRQCAQLAGNGGTQQIFPDNCVRSIMAHNTSRTAALCDVRIEVQSR